MDMIVISVVSVPEVQTGDLLYQVAFGNFIDTPKAISDSVPPGQISPKKIPVMWATINLKTDKVPYMVGSKWKMEISEKGKVTLVAVR